MFRKTHAPALYDAEKSGFLPPTDRIELVENTTDAFPITTYLAAQKRLDRSAATTLLEGIVDDLMDTVSRNGEVVLDGLGYLVADGASVTFRPFEAEAFAAEPIAAPQPVASEVPGPVAGDRAEPLGGATNGPAEPEEEIQADESAAPKRYSPWMIGGAVAAILIAAVLIWQYQPAWLGMNAAESVDHRGGGSDFCY